MSATTGPGKARSQLGQIAAEPRVPEIGGRHQPQQLDVEVEASPTHSRVMRSLRANSVTMTSGSTTHQQGRGQQRRDQGVVERGVERAPPPPSQATTTQQAAPRVACRPGVLAAIAMIAAVVACRMAVPKPRAIQSQICRSGKARR